MNDKKAATAPASLAPDLQALQQYVGVSAPLQYVEVGDRAAADSAAARWVRLGEMRAKLLEEGDGQGTA